MFVLVEVGIDDSEFHWRVFLFRVVGSELFGQRELLGGVICAVRALRLGESLAGSGGVGPLRERRRRWEGRVEIAWRERVRMVSSVFGVLFRCPLRMTDTRRGSAFGRCLFAVQGDCVLNDFSFLFDTIDLFAGGKCCFFG